ncbi:MAG: 4-vinyl reductase [Candidatus Woesearchaeota archaeon]
MATPSILEKIIRFQAFKWKDGKIILWNVPGYLSPLFSVVYQQRLLEKLHGHNEAAEFFYNVGKFQGQQTFRVIARNYGYNNLIKDKKRLLEFQTGQSALVGVGEYTWVKFDMDNKKFVVRGRSSFADEYVALFGIQKKPVCHLVRGLCAGFIEELIKEPCLSIETSCIASSNPVCEFVVRPLKAWDKTDPLVKSQWVRKIHDLRSLGSLKSP